ncbi:hypothetical protein D3C85_1278980 [compost metagenome]
MRSAICRGVPIRLVLKPSLYCTRSSKVDLAQLPSPSGLAAPAFFTSLPKPLTASGSALAIISCNTARASASVSRAMTKALTPTFTEWPLIAALARISSTWALMPSTVLPLVKYQSDTREAMSRAARELPPWKISGCGCCRGLGLRV